MSPVVVIRRLPGRSMEMFFLMVIVVHVFFGERWTATEAASKLRRSATQSPAAVYQGACMSAWSPGRFR